MMIRGHCDDRFLSVGSIIMGKAAAHDGSRLITISKNGVELLNNTSYEPGDTLTVKLVKPTVQAVFEVHQKGPSNCSAQFKGGGCGGKRIAISRSDIEIQMPLEAGCVISIIAGWSIDYSQAVKISEPFILLPEANNLSEL